MYAIRLISSTTPYNMFVFPLLKESITAKNDNIISTVDLMSIPKTKSISNKTQINTTEGIVKPILARAEPKAKLILVCKRFFLAACIEAIPSGRSTILAIITPTKDCGSPASIIIPSMIGDMALANKTTMIRHAISETKLMIVSLLLGGAECESIFSLLSAGKK